MAMTAEKPLFAKSTFLCNKSILKVFKLKRNTKNTSQTKHKEEGKDQSWYALFEGPSHVVTCCTPRTHLPMWYII